MSTIKYLMFFFNFKKQEASKPMPAPNSITLLILSKSVFFFIKLISIKLLKKEEV